MRSEQAGSKRSAFSCQLAAEARSPTTAMDNRKGTVTQAGSHAKPTAFSRQLSAEKLIAES
jgi:hypothetical protein